MAGSKSVLSGSSEKPSPPTSSFVNLAFDFQAMVRTPECQAALIVYEKYKRKLGLGHMALITMHGHALEFADARAQAGKTTSKELLVQEVSGFCKRTYGAVATV